MCCNIYLNVTKKMLLKLYVVTFKINVIKEMLLKSLNGVVLRRYVSHFQEYYITQENVLFTTNFSYQKFLVITMINLHINYQKKILLVTKITIIMNKKLYWSLN